MKLGVIMDPVAEVEPKKDTTLGILAAAQRRGWSLVYFTADNVWLRDGESRGAGRALTVHLDESPWFYFGDTEDMPLASLDALLMRKNPPVDEMYLSLCHILEFIPGGRVFNAPAGICAANEKVFPQRFASFQPPTIVSTSMACIRDFVTEHKDAVIKPLNGMQGASVFRLGDDDVNIDAIIENVTAYGRRFSVVQKLIPEYAQGDKRVLVLDGEPLPHALLRVPQPGRLRANLAAGGVPQVVAIDDRDREICAAIAPYLRELGLLFVGLDIIGGWLTEINVTSPTCMREIDRARNSDIGGEIMRAIEMKVTRC